MTFEEFWNNRHTFEKVIRCTRSEAEFIWNAAKQDVNPHEYVWVVEPYENDCVTYPFWHVVGTEGMLFESSRGKDACMQWALAEGYKIHDS